MASKVLAVGWTGGGGGVEWAATCSAQLLYARVRHVCLECMRVCLQIMRVVASFPKNPSRERRIGRPL